MFSNVAVHGFHCQALDNGVGHTWTLTTQLGQLLHEAESTYGPRDRDWTPIGIEFCGNTPKVWYPGDRKHVAIQLTISACQNPRRALFQLAHEVIHLLSPSGNRSAKVIEEGLATVFSHQISSRHALGLTTDVASYLLAEQQVCELLQVEADVIKRVREREPNFSRITPQLLTEFAPHLSQETSEGLCQPFVR